MKLLLGCIILLLAAVSCTSEQPQKNHPFISEEKIDTPALYYEDVISTNIDKFNTSFSPDGKTIYYTATSQKLGITGIAYQSFEQGKYTEPEFVPFVSHDMPIADVHISQDGNTMFYSTFKDYEGKPDGFNFNLWTSELVNGKWQEPTPLGAPIASSGNEFYPITTTSGTLYFNSDREGNSDIYYSELTNGKYQEPVKLPDNINSARREADAFIAPDESYLIFVRVDEEDGYGNSDLYISFNLGNNEWSDPTNMGSKINSDQIDGSPCVSPDGNYLFFTTGRIKDGLKEKAASSYKYFKEVHKGSNNGSLNFYYVSFNPNDYR